MFQPGLLALKTPAVLEDPPDNNSVFEQVVEDDNRTRGLRSQNGAGFLPGKDV